jgi:endonuclease G
MKTIITLIILFCSNLNAEILSVHCPVGCPSNPDGNDLVFAHLYALSNNPTTKFADWVAYEVDVVNFGDSPGRKWKADPLLDDSETLEPPDYTGANDSVLKADRGHQAPLASFAGSRYWSELNYLSNITPQHKKLNQGAWKALEDAVRAAVSYRKSLYVITGTIYEGQPVHLPQANETHRVPSAYFKIVYNLKGEAAAFFMTQSDQTGTDFCSKQKPLAFIKAKITFELPLLTINNGVLEKLGC